MVTGKVVSARQNLELVAQFFKEYTAESVTQDNREEVNETVGHGDQHEGITEHFRNEHQHDSDTVSHQVGEERVASGLLSGGLNGLQDFSRSVFVVTSTLINDSSGSVVNWVFPDLHLEVVLQELTALAQEAHNEEKKEDTESLASVTGLEVLKQNRVVFVAFGQPHVHQHVHAAHVHISHVHAA